MIILEEPPLEALESREERIIAESTAAGHPLAFLGFSALTLAQARCDIARLGNGARVRRRRARPTPTRATRWAWPPKPAPGAERGARSCLTPVSGRAGHTARPLVAARAGTIPVRALDVVHTPDRRQDPWSAPLLGGVVLEFSSPKSGRKPENKIAESGPAAKHVVREKLETKPETNGPLPVGACKYDAADSRPGGHPSMTFWYWKRCVAEAIDSLRTHAEFDLAFRAMSDSKTQGIVAVPDNLIMLQRERSCRVCEG